MSTRSSGSAFASSLTSDESYIGILPIVSLIEDVDAYAGSVFEVISKTINDLQTLERAKHDRGEVADWAKLNVREDLLSSFMHRTSECLDDISDMRKADFGALSLVWGNGAGLVRHALQDIIAMLEDFARQVIALRQNFDGTGHRVPPQSEMAEGLLARLRSLLDLGSNDRAIRYRREVHPCRGALQLIKGDDRGDIDRCLRRDLKPAEIGRLERGGNCGTYVFWKCDSCEFRLKYFVTKSRAASLLQNDDHITFSPARLLCSRAFLAMSHLEQREIRRHSSSNGPPRYTCLICALHRVAARPGSDHTFFTREDYARHIEDTHIRANLPPAFVLHKLGIELGGSLPDGVRRELWTV